MSERGIDAAIKAVGSQVAVARALGVTEQAVSIWVKRGWVPARRAVELEQLTGVARADLVSQRLRELVGADPVSF